MSKKAIEAQQAFGSRKIREQQVSGFSGKENSKRSQNIVRENIENQRNSEKTHKQFI